MTPAVTGQPAQPVALAVDIGGTHTKLARLALLKGGDGSPQVQLQDFQTLPTAARGDPQAYLQDLHLALRSLVHGGPLPAGIGLSVAGFLRPDRRGISYNPNTPALVDVDFINLLADLGLPVSVEGDLNAPALAEATFGEFRSKNRVMAAVIGTGLGAGMVIDRQVLRFAGGTLGDSGHIILDPAGPRCTAGCQGCAEALIAAPQVERLAAAVGRAVPARQVIAAASQGEAWARAIMDVIGTELGQWLASLAPLFLPEAIVLCGGVAQAGEALLSPAIRRFRQLAGPEYAHCTLSLSRFGANAGLIGAAAPFLDYGSMD